MTIRQDTLVIIIKFSIPKNNIFFLTPRAFLGLNPALGTKKEKQPSCLKVFSLFWLEWSYRIF